ncbi:hypothetical protein [Streptomyces sp. NPDC050738]|uniref:hypothetical protein n=1 Tax=Streptomyces sp. NPDC050738 TaxID=3154744 RepID=UPI003413F1EA
MENWNLNLRLEAVDVRELWSSFLEKPKAFRVFVAMVISFAVLAILASLVSLRVAGGVAIIVSGFLGVLVGYRRD